MNQKYFKKLGFTLIELLIVIAIVGIMIAVSTSSYITATKQSRDTKRKSDLEQIRQALETFRAQNGVYPATGSWQSDLQAGYITLIPTDPKSNVYVYTGLTNYTYTLCATLETQETEYCVTQP